MTVKGETYYQNLKIDESNSYLLFEVTERTYLTALASQPIFNVEVLRVVILARWPGAKDISRAQDYFSSTAQLEFWQKPTTG